MNEPRYDMTRTMPSLCREPSTRMHEITLHFEDALYPFWIGSRCEEEIAAHLAGFSASSLHVVTDRTVLGRHAGSLVRRLQAIASTHVYCIDDGEQVKSLTTLEHVANQLLAAGADRSSIIVAMGGGVVGNVAGLVASLLFRGIRLVHIPTTLIAMSDSVISLKQAVNMTAGKNLLGSFYLPSAVFADTACLLSLPSQHIRSGLCEIIKNALAITPSHVPLLTDMLTPQASYDETMLAKLVKAGIQAKQSVMFDDKHERRRALAFEYGHTVGHAIEWCGRGKISHGEAVGLGMVVAAEVAHAQGLLSQEVRDLHYRLLALNGVTIRVPSTLTPDAVMTAIQSDNKRGYCKAARDEIPMILLRGLGQPICNDDGRPLTCVSTELVAAMLQKHIFHLT